jgi:hypothetical protein
MTARQKTIDIGSVAVNHLAERMYQQILWAGF